MNNMRGSEESNSHYLGHAQYLKWIVRSVADLCIPNGSKSGKKEDKCNDEGDGFPFAGLRILGYWYL